MLDKIQDEQGNDLNKTQSAADFDKLLDIAEKKMAEDNPPEDENNKDKKPESNEEPDPDSEPNTEDDPEKSENKDEPDGDKPPETPSPEALIETANSLAGIKPDEEPNPDEDLKLDDVDDDPVITQKLEDELKEIEQNPHTEQAVKSTISNLRNALSDVSKDVKKAKVFEKQIEDLQKQIEESLDGNDLGVTKEEFELIQGQLLMLKRRFQLDTDPQFTKEFDDEIDVNTQQLKDLLIKYGLPEKTPADKPDDMSIEKLEGMGGLVSVFESSPDYFKQIKDLMAETNELDAEDFSGTLKNVRQLKKRRSHKLTQESEKADEFFKGVDKHNETLKQQQVDKNQELVDFRTNLSDTMVKKFKFLQEREVKGTDEEKEISTNHNEKVKVNLSKLDGFVNAKGLDDWGDMTELALMTGPLTDSLQLALEENKALRDKIKKTSSSTRIREVNNPPVSEDTVEFKPTKSFDDALDYVEAKNAKARR